MSIKTRQVHAETETTAAVDASGLVAEYLARTERLARTAALPLFSRLTATRATLATSAHTAHTVRARPLPADLATDYRLAYESPQNLALELEKSILYENADSIDAIALKSLGSHGEDSLWNGKPQQYFESMNYAERPQSEDDVAEGEEYDSDSLAP